MVSRGLNPDIVRKALLRHESIRGAAEELGVVRSSIRYWVASSPHLADLRPVYLGRPNKPPSQRTHNESFGKSLTPEYRCWAHIKTRCLNPRSHCYQDYGGRGIKVCDRWAESYEAFLADVGRRPSPNHSIDRIDVNGNYEPGNVRWATRQEQMNNRRTNKVVTVGTVSKTVADWARHSGLSHGTISARLELGWPPEQAVTIPTSPCRRPRKEWRRP